jgi:segregation and condensation protein A
LIEIKSKMLLPRSPADPGDLTMEDPRTELVEKLLEYKRFKKLAEVLARQEERNERVFEKPQEDIARYTGIPDEYLDLELKQFVSAFNLFLQKKKKVEEIQRHHRRSEKQRITAELRIAAISAFFRKNPDQEVNFCELVEKKKDKYDIAVTFSSVLEMMKNRQLMAAQQYTYGDIFVWVAERGVQNDQ